MLLVEKDKKTIHFDAVGAKEPIDVTGAGDTVIAAYALGLASGLSFAESAQVANHAGGIVVMKKGTASVKFGGIVKINRKKIELMNNSTKQFCSDFRTHTACRESRHRTPRRKENCSGKRLFRSFSRRTYSLFGRRERTWEIV